MTQPAQSNRFFSPDWNIVAGWASRVVVVLLSFVNTRLLIEQMGTEGLAAFTIILSLAPWLALLNLGFPITVQNKIARLRGHQIDHYPTRNRAFGSMLVITLAMSPIVVLVGWLSHYYFLSNYTFVSASAVIGASLFLYISGQCQLLTQVMYAEQKALLPNIYPAFASIWTTAALLVTQSRNIEEFNQLLLILSIANLLMPIHASLKLGIFRYAKFKIGSAINLILISRHQLLFAAFSSATLAIDYAVMSRTLEATGIVQYNLTSRLFTVVLLLHGVMVSTNWSPLAELLHASKLQEAKRMLEQLLKKGLLLGGLFGVLIMVTMQPITQLWTGGKIDGIPFILGIGWFLYIIVRIWTDTYSMALLAFNMAKDLNRYIPFQAAISVTAQLMLASHYGAAGIVFGLIISFLLTASWILPVKFYKLVKE